tara:strand:+ start:172 stop:567 length:396 start_codon:yes stop_codon:yes gene_type:complete
MKPYFLTLFILILSCGTQKNNISKPSSSLSISPAAITLLDVITGKFPGIRVIGDNVANSNPKILIRGGSLSINNQAYAIFDVDGSIQTEFPSYIDPQQIKNISILKSLAATNRYGGIARGGAIIIKLKTSE